MLRSILLSVLGVCLVAGPTEARNSPESLPMSAAPARSGPLDGFLTPYPRFAFAAANTTVLAS